MLNALAIVLEKPEQLTLSRLDLTPPGREDVVIRTSWSGISTGTERLLYTGRMPPFPGMGYPQAGADTTLREGQSVFVPGARCFGPVHGLFGGAASQLVSRASRVIPVDDTLGDKAILLALAATAQHAHGTDAGPGGDLIVGHGVLGRLLARLCVAAGGAPPTVWETNPARAEGAEQYEVMSPEIDSRRDYKRIFDVSGDPTILDRLIARLAPGGEIVLAGFYDQSLAFSFPPAFMREARIRIAAEWREPDLHLVQRLIADGRLSLDGLITHRSPASDAAQAYLTAFNDSSCLKMVLDWSSCP
jgi:3-hydroxyethyl bacteriochlorophyllide a dehydrogenase